MSQVVIRLVLVLVVISISMHACKCNARHLMTSRIHADQAAHHQRPLTESPPPKLDGEKGDDVPVAEKAEADDQTFFGAITAIKHIIFRPDFEEEGAAGYNEAAGQVFHHRHHEENKETKGMRKSMRGRVLTVGMIKDGKKKMEEKDEGKVNRDDDDESNEAAATAEDESSTSSVVMMDYAQPHRKPPIHNEKN